MSIGELAASAYSDIADTWREQLPLADVAPPRDRHGAVPPRWRRIPITAETDTRVGFATYENACARVTEVF